MLVGRSILAAAMTLAVSLPATPAPAAGGVTARVAGSCTLVGTTGADRLVGTRRADVICGHGGNDTILGRGGGDRILSGAGKDEVRGGSGRDFLSGGNGQDLLTGGDGDDSLAGGGGADDLTGDDGQDEVVGGTGDDFLDGGPEGDDIDGGDGTNTCVVDAEDAAVRCVYDLEEPSVVGVQPSTSGVDVSEADQSVTVRAHVTDDTGVTSVSLWVKLGGGAANFYADWADLVEGTPRDGWWESTVEIPRYARPGTYSYAANLRDRMGRSVYGYAVPNATLEVTASVVDTERPVLRELSQPSPETVIDVREAAGELVVTAHLTDNLSGVGQATVCARPATHYQPFSRCAFLSLTSGSVLDGIWSATIPLAQGETTDKWKLSALLKDRANTWDQVDYTSGLESWGIHFSPEGSGVFQVIGSDPPTTGQAPQVASIELTPSEVDTLPSAATVSAVVALDDPDGIVVSAQIALHQVRPGGGGYTDITYGSSMRRGEDGLWRGDVVLPQGAPPGQYQARVIASDGQASYIHYVQSFVTVVDSRTP